MSGTVVKIKFKLVGENAILPAYSKDGDAAFDIYASEDKTLRSGKVELVKTGVASEFPAGYFVSFRDRSSMGIKGVNCLAGVIDSGYRGEWGVVMINFGEEKYEIKIGDRIAQGILHKLPRVKIEKVGQLEDSERGKGGFGSTGR